MVQVGRRQKHSIALLIISKQYLFTREKISSPCNCSSNSGSTGIFSIVSLIDCISSSCHSSIG